MDFEYKVFQQAVNSEKNSENKKVSAPNGYPCNPRRETF